jgi:hypothetical protein
MMKAPAIQGLFYCLVICGFSNVLSFEPTRHLSSPNGKTQLNAFLSTAAAAVDTFWRTSPYAAAGLICGTKASAADFIAQQRQYHKRQADDSDSEVQLNDDGSLAVVLEEVEPAANKMDLQRNFVYIIYGAFYQGMAQEYIYNHLYPVLFGAGTDIRTVLTKVTFDLLLQTTLVTLPIAYMSKALLYRYSVGEAWRRYVDDIRNHGLLTKYFALWGPVQCLTFSVVPQHLRVTFIALISFFWVIILSSIASKTPVPATSSDEECLLEDGLTCNIDG